MSGTITNPETVSVPDNTTNTNSLFGKAGEGLVAELHGVAYTSNYRNSVFAYFVNAVTLPVNGATVVSKFTVLNPVGSGKNLELLSLDWAYAVATTAVNGLGVFFSTPANTASATTVTPATVQSGFLGGSTPAGVGQSYSSWTTVGTPLQAALVGYTGAVTSTAAAVNSYFFNGRVIVAPGVAVHVMNTVVASTASGFSGQLTWAEHPL